MSKQIMKPVWRVNSGSGVPSDLDSAVVDFSGTIYNLLPTETLRDKKYWTKYFEVRPTISVYQTTRTKAAKYTSKDCQVCEGEGKRKLKDWITKTPFTGVCIYCNGKGYKLEAIK